MHSTASYLDRALNDAFATADKLASDTRGAPNISSLIDSTIPAGLGSLLSGSTISLASDEYHHFRARTYSAFKVIAQRIAAQPVMVARVGRPVDRSRSLKTYLKDGVLRERDVPAVFKRFSATEIEMLPDHPLLAALDDPNEFHTPATLWLCTVFNLLVTGRSLWLTNPDPARPEIVPIPTTWATPLHDSRSNKLYAKWSIRPPNGAATPVEVDGAFVMNACLPDPEDPFLGCLSPLRMQADAVLTDESISTAQRVAFKNEIDPAMAIYVGDAATGDGKRQLRLTPEQRKQLITWITQSYQGAIKRGLPIILDSIIRDVKNLRNKPAEIGFLESMQAVQRQIFEGAGVPPISAGHTEGANYATSAVADHHLIVNAVGPIATLLSEALTAWVLPLFHKGRDRVRAWIVQPDAFNPDLEIRRWTAARQSFAISRNDVRTKLLGLPPIDGWDDVVVPAGMQSVPVGQAVIPIVGTNTPSPTSELPAPDAADNENMREAEKSHTKDARGDWLQAQAAAETELQTALEGYYDALRESAVQSLRGEKRHKSAPADALADRVFNVDDWTRKMVDTVRPILADQMRREASRIQTAGTKDVLITLAPELEQRITATLQEILVQPWWREISIGTKQTIVDSLRAGLDAGDTIDELAKHLDSALGPEFSRARSLTIARTEVGGGLNAAHYLTQQQLEAEGIAFGSEWLSILDNDTRPDHVALSGVRIAAGEMFDVGGFPAPYPGHHSLPAEQRVRCRCTIVSLTEPFERARFGGRLKSLNHSMNGKAHCHHG